MFEIILVHSPLVSAVSLEPTQNRLIKRGHRCQLPAPYSHAPALPKWSNWAEHVLEITTPSTDAVFVGHSMGGRLAAQLACVSGSMAFICLDAAIPPSSGWVPPVDDDFLEFVKSLPIDEDGGLPPWHEWWPIDVFEGGEDPDEIRARLFSETPHLPLSWFNDGFDMPDWSPASTGYIRTSRTFAEAARAAETLGWPVIKLKGTHLHPASAPDETADAIIECCRKMRS